MKKRKLEVEQGTKKCKGDYLVTREIIESARGRETSQISMIKVRGSEREWVGVGRSRRDDKQKRLLKQ